MNEKSRPPLIVFIDLNKKQTTENGRNRLYPWRVLPTITCVKPSAHQTGNYPFKNNPSAFWERLSSSEGCFIYELLGAIHSTKIPIGPTWKSGPPQKVDRTDPLSFGPKFRKFWLNGSHPLIHVYDVNHTWHLSHSSFLYRIPLTPIPRTTASRFQSTTVQTETRLSHVLICRVGATRADGPSVARLYSWRASNLIVLFSWCPTLKSVFHVPFPVFMGENHLTCVYYLRGKRIKEIAFCEQIWCMMFDWILL